MFTLKENRIIKGWPVSVPVAQDGGKITHHDITVDYDLISEMLFTELAIKGDANVLARIVKGWSGIGDADGKALPYNADNLLALSSKPNFRQAVLKAFWDADQGVGPVKN